MVAQCGAGPTRKYGGGLARKGGQHGVPDEKDAPVHRVQPPRCQTMADRAAAETERGKLLPRHDSMLFRGEIRHRLIPTFHVHNATRESVPKGVPSVVHDIRAQRCTALDSTEACRVVHALPATPLT